MITHEQKQVLQEAGKHISQSQWTIGDIAAEVLAEATRNKMELLRQVGEYCGLSPRRVEKLMYVSLSFPEDIRSDTWGFGYYERAMPLGEHALDAIEFLGWYKNENGRTLGITEFVRIFRSQILGETVFDEDSGASFFQYDFSEAMGYVQRLRYMFREYPQIRGLLDQLEEFLRRDQCETVTTTAGHITYTLAEIDYPIQTHPLE